MKKFKISALLIYAVLLIFSACGGGGGGSDDPDNSGDNPGDDPKNPGDPGDPTATLEINGNTYSYTLPGGTVFKAMLTPDIATTKKFPCNIDADDNYDEATDVANIPDQFIMGETEVTYQLWKEVYDWATDASRGSKKYNFANAGTITNGSGDTSQYPVNRINWRDSIVWCNALTEYYNANNGTAADLALVYCADAAFIIPIRDSRDGSYYASHNSSLGSSDNPFVNSSAKGFRLPLSIEWEFTARYIGTSKPSHINYVFKDDIYYTKGNSASGATDDCNNASATSDVAAYGLSSITVVKTKVGNNLGLYDMSGNVCEWCFDLDPSDIIFRVVRGGSIYSNNSYLQLGCFDSDKPWNEYSTPGLGFRFCRNK